MPEPEIDAEELAALLDGRLTGERRAALLSRLAASDEMTGVYADAVAATASGTHASGRREDTGPAHWFARGRARSVAALAASLLIVVAASFWLQSRRQSASDPVGTMVAHLSAPDAGLTGGWSERSWSVTRGPASALTESARAARAGALSVDLELALRSGDRAASGLAREIAVLLQEQPASAPAVLLYEDLGRRAASPWAQVQDAQRQARRAAAAVLDGDAFTLGAFAEAALVAADRRDAEFFAGSRVATSRSLGPEVGQLLERIRSEVNRGTSRVGPNGVDTIDWSVVTRLARELLATIAG